MVNDTNNFDIAGAVRGLTAPYIRICIKRVVCMGVLATALAGCGLKGDLYLPQKQGPVVVTPATAESSSSSSASSQAAP